MPCNVSVLPNVNDDIQIVQRLIKCMFYLGNVECYWNILNIAFFYFQTGVSKCCGTLTFSVSVTDNR